MKTTDEILENIIDERELKPRTIRTYKKSINYFEEHINMSLPEFLDIVEKEEINGIRWKNSTLKKELTTFRKHLNKQYKNSTSKIYLSKIIAICNFYELEVGKLKTPKTEKHRLRDISENITQKELQECINQPNTTEIKPLTLLLSSTGLSPVDALKLTHEDHLKATQEYHNYNKHRNIIRAIEEMDQQECIATLRGHREKSGVEYLTFASPEYVKAVNILLLSKEKKLKLKDKIFTLSRSTLNRRYKEINDQLDLGVNANGESRFSMKGLRSFHSTQLEIAGMSESRINILEGRENKSVINEHYIKIDSNELKKQYIECLPFLLVEDINKVKSELENEKEKNNVLHEENIVLKKQNDENSKRLDNLEKIILGDVSDDEISELDKLL